MMVGPSRRSTSLSPRSVQDISPPAEITSPSSITRRSASTAISGKCCCNSSAYFQWVVMRRPVISPVAASKKAPAQIDPSTTPCAWRSRNHCVSLSPRSGTTGVDSAGGKINAESAHEGFALTSPVGIGSRSCPGDCQWVTCKTVCC